jgi:hypothetical protein
MFKQNLGSMTYFPKNNLENYVNYTGLNKRILHTKH